MNFYKKYIQLCNSISKTPSRVALEIGLTKTAVNGWKTKGTHPTDANLKKIADYFHVSPDYFTEDTKKSPDSENQGMKVSSDVAKHMERIMKELEQEEALMFDGEPLDEESLELIRASLKNAYAIAMAKKPIKKESEKK